MAEPNTYSRDPLVEVLLDIQVDTPSDFSLDSLAKCQNKVKAAYPQKRAARNVTGEFSVGQKITASASDEAAGYVFLSPDGKQLFQAKRSGFTFNRLHPYTGWNAFVAEAKQLWEEYRRIARPRGYKRLAVRSINRFDFAEPTVTLETYFRTFPEISRDLPQTMAGFFFKFNLPLDDIGTLATVTQTAVEPRTPDGASIILDIDVFRSENLPAGNELWPLFDALRDWKNKVFEASITDKARELIR
jgi:uncharacterized protein (TIGR04255 family)